MRSPRRRPALIDDARRHGLSPALRRQARRQEDEGRAPKTGDTTINQTSVIGSGRVPNASEIPYDPAVLTDWDSDTDPGDVDDAVDQLAERVDDLEGGAGHAALTLEAGVDAFMSLAAQELGLDVQTANTFFGGPAAGGAADPAFRALVDADIPAAIARDSEVTADIATHAAIATAHQDAPGLIATHAAIATAHQDAPALIATHAAMAAAHHAKYTDAEARTAVPFVSYITFGSGLEVFLP